MLRGSIVLFLLLVTSCSTNTVKEQYKYPIKCNGFNEIKYCEGYSPQNLDCRCMKIETGVFSEYRIA